MCLHRTRRPALLCASQEFRTEIKKAGVVLRWTKVPSTRAEGKPWRTSLRAVTPCATEGAHFGDAAFLKELLITDFALVERQTIRLGPGLNAITGESGAGKSVLVSPDMACITPLLSHGPRASNLQAASPTLPSSVTRLPLLAHVSLLFQVAAIGQVLGDTATDDMVRPPAQSAAVEGIFSVRGGRLAAISELLDRVGLYRSSTREVTTPSASRPGASFDIVIRREVRWRRKIPR